VSTNNETKIKKLLDLHVPGSVILASWLDANGFSHDLQQRYRKSGWLESVGVGAFKRPGETVDWHGGLYSLQEQVQLSVHVGGLTALSMLGFSHYIRTGAERVFLFSLVKTKLPAWFKNHSWGVSIVHIRTSFLTKELGTIQQEVNRLTLTISSAERAMLECLYLAPYIMDISEAYQIMSGLVNLRPALVQKLLEECNSIKVKRLFLFLAEKANQQWFQYLELSTINLGKGDRSIVKNGVYNSSYRITIPKELA